MICGHDCDDVFGYTTHRYIKVRDRRLGLLYYFLIFGILGGFTIIWKIIIDHGMSKQISPMGVVAASV